ncbi:hypothetical protein [Desulfuromonas versatilis]|uniref:hypothetical protein n=1 Tax=Desulfuromonas versatilis TaxID=2802975 RepID=UPI001C85CC83|nr:hypothetical protein [Desulfuromonas versatilis]
MPGFLVIRKWPRGRFTRWPSFCWQQCRVTAAAWAEGFLPSPAVGIQCHATHKVEIPEMTATHFMPKVASYAWMTMVADEIIIDSIGHQ